MAYGKSEQSNMRETKTGGGDLWKPPDGDSRLRIMPPATAKQETFWFKTGTHFNVGPDESPVPCPVESGVRETCFLCRLIKRLKKGDKDEEDEAEGMGARPRFLISIVDYADPEAGVQVWACPVTVFRQLKKYRLNEDEYGDMTDLEDGYDILLEKTGSGINTKYDAAPARKNSKFPTKELLNHRDDSVAEMYQALVDEELELPDLSAVQVFPDDDRMEAIWKGVSSDRPRTESSESEDDDPDDDGGAEDDGGEEEKEEEEKPRERKSRSRSRRAKEEDSDDAGDDAGEEEPPKRERRSEKSKTSGRSNLRGRVEGLD